MTSIKYFYSASVMGYGTGRYWHKYYKFPKLNRVTKTITLEPKLGIPFAVIKFGNSVWNKVGLHNIGMKKFYLDLLPELILYTDPEDLIISLAGTDDDIDDMVRIIDRGSIPVGGIELNFSCPNVKDQKK